MAGPHHTGAGAAGRRSPMWNDESAGPVVRPYALTGGRTDHDRAEQFDLVALILTDEEAAAGQPSGGATATPMAAGLGAGLPAHHWAQEPEHEMILTLCRTPLSVVEIASELELPLGVVRVLLGDLLDRSLIQVRRPAPVAQFPSERVLKEVIDGIRAL